MSMSLDGRLRDVRCGTVNDPSELSIMSARSASAKVLCFVTGLLVALALVTAGCGSSGQDINAADDV
ncbi:MAG: hypothetical protein ACI88C_001906 [Acidimicrobiales bacterium]|jgi:hypothetical protein